MEMDALRLMTAGTPTRNYDEIEKLLSCPICLEVFSKPVVILPCQHNLCRQCANDMYQNRGTLVGSGGRFKCPSCRYDVVLDRRGVHGLQRNLLVENIVDMYQSDGRKSSFKKVEQSTSVMCEDHEGEKVNIYCTTCQKPTCSLCKVFGQHQECDVAPMEKIYKEQKSEISDAIAMLGSGNEKLQTIISQTEELAERTKSNGESVLKNVNDAFDQIYVVLEDRKSNMLTRVDADILERNQVLETMLKNYNQQLESGNKLMSASLSLAEEKNIPQFLKLSREMTEKVIEVVSAADIRKPPFNIQSMGEFHVNFHFQKEILTKLDFTPVTEDEASHADETLLDLPTFSTKESGCDVIKEEEVDDLATQEKASLVIKKDLSPAGDTSTTDLSSKHHTDDEHRNYEYYVEESPQNMKKGRWYDMYVRQLPPPISMTGFSAPMESSVHMKVVIPAAAKNNMMEELDELKKDNETTAASVVSEDIDDLDLEIEQLLAPRRRRWASRLTYQPSPEISPRSSPTRFPSQSYAPAEETPSPPSSPIFYRRRRLRNASPTSQRTTSSILNRSDRGNEGLRVSSPSTALPNHLRNESPARRVSFSNNERRQRSKSPAPSSSSPTSSEMGRTQERSSDSPSNSQASRRPRVYCTHKRRTWSHLLDKR